MNKQELIEEIKQSNEVFPKMPVLYLIEQLDEPQPLKLKDIISRMKQLFPLSRSEWIDEIKKEFGEEFCLWKYKAGYEQGKLEGIVEREKVTIPQFVAKYIEFKKTYDFHVYGAMREIENHYDKRVPEWFYEKNIETFVQAWLYGYEIEEEKRYLVKMKGLNEDSSYLNYDSIDDEWYFTDAENGPAVGTHHTRKQLEEAGFGWMFDCKGLEVEEVTT